MLDKLPVLSRPPLVETAFCVNMRCKILQFDEIVAIVKTIAPTYIKHEEIHRQEIHVSNGTDGAIRQVDKVVGARFRKDANHILTLQGNGADEMLFAYSLLSPYSSWNEFIKEALSLYGKFKLQVSIDAIVRIGVRSIDRIIPMAGLLNLRDILKVVPPGVAGLDSPVVKDFLYKDTIYSKELNLHVTMIRATQSGIPGSLPNVILDTDVFFTNEGLVSDHFLERRLEDVRAMKDHVFKNSVGEKYLEAWL